MRTILSFRRIIKYNKMIWKCREMKHLLIETKRKAEELLKSQNEWLDQKRAGNNFYNDEELREIFKIYSDAGEMRRRIEDIDVEINVQNSMIESLIMQNY